MDRVRLILTRYRGVLLAAAAVLLLLWVSFLDSHSLVRRVAWHREAESLRAQNEELRLEIERLRGELSSDLTDEQVERIAREQYGMQRLDETVYPIENRE